VVSPCDRLGRVLRRLSVGACLFSGMLGSGEFLPEPRYLRPHRHPCRAVCADVSGTDLDSVLKCTREWPVLPELFLTTAFSHHACKRFLTDQSSLRPSPTVLRQNITLQLPLRR
jgi:hypothetical protein